MSIGLEQLENLRSDAQRRPGAIEDDIYRTYRRKTIPETRDPRTDAIMFGLAMNASDEQRSMAVENDYLVNTWEHAISCALNLDGLGESWEEMKSILTEEAKLAEMGGWEKRSRAISHLASLI